MKSYSNTSINKDERAREIAKMWMGYGRCEDCRAIQGQPCRDRLGPSVVLLNKPHPYRPELPR